jgi:nicotinamide mononucleotide transporter
MIDYLLSPYKTYSNTDIILEVMAVLFGIWSVLLARKNNILVYPTGLINTIIYVYLLYNWNLLGDMLINIYYTIMSFYGWIMWQQNENSQPKYPISVCTKNDYKFSLMFFTITIVLVSNIYIIFEKYQEWVSSIDMVVTGLFCVGMWLMAKRKLESWIFWIIGNIISIPLFLYKGYAITSFQYFIFTIIAYFAYTEWKKYLAKPI